MQDVCAYVEISRYGLWLWVVRASIYVYARKKSKLSNEVELATIIYWMLYDT